VVGFRTVPTVELALLPRATSFLLHSSLYLSLPSTAEPMPSKPLTGRIADEEVQTAATHHLGIFFSSFCFCFSYVYYQLFLIF
jgi:hypothetical protein